MSVLSIFKTIGKTTLKVADAGHSASLPILSQLDQVADLVKDIKGRRAVDTEALNHAIVGLKEVKTAIVLQPRGTIEHKRLKVASLNALAVVLIYLGLPPEVADQVALYVTGPILAFILGDTVRPSKGS